MAPVVGALAQFAIGSMLGSNNDAMKSLSAVEELMSYDPVSRWVGVRQQLPQLSDLWQNTPLAQDNAGFYPLMKSLL
jgi:hypothetical protein